MNYSFDKLPKGTKIYTVTKTGFENACRKASGFPISCSIAFNTITGHVFTYTQCKTAKLQKCWQDETAVVADLSGHDIIELGAAPRPIIQHQTTKMVERIQKALELQRYNRATVVGLIATLH